MVTGGAPMTEGQHYWEVELTSHASGDCDVMVGVARPGLNLSKGCALGVQGVANFVFAFDGSLCGNGRGLKDRAHPHGRLRKGDRVGMLLDLDAGWMRVYRNGVRFGPGFTEGVTGPLVRAAALWNKGSVVSIVPGATAPEGAGGADEPWPPPVDEPQEQVPEPPPPAPEARESVV